VHFAPPFAAINNTFVVQGSGTGSQGSGKGGRSSGKGSSKQEEEDEERILISEVRAHVLCAVVWLLVFHTLVFSRCWLLAAERHRPKGDRQQWQWFGVVLQSKLAQHACTHASKQASSVQCTWHYSFFIKPG
jgi:hypothetical protein